MIPYPGLIPDLWSLDQGIALFPKFDLSVFAAVPAVGDYTVVGGVLACCVGCLRGRGYRRENWGYREKLGTGGKPGLDERRVRGAYQVRG